MKKEKQNNSGQIKISFPEVSRIKNDGKVISINRNFDNQRKKVAQIILNNSKAY